MLTGNTLFFYYYSIVHLLPLLHSMAMLPPLTAFLAAATHTDAVSQKLALQLLHALMNKWMGGPNGADSLALATGTTFMQFTTEHIVPACFAAVLRPDFDMQDAQSGLQVVNEVASMHIGMWVLFVYRWLPWEDVLLLVRMLLLVHTSGGKTLYMLIIPTRFCSSNRYIQ